MFATGNVTVIVSNMDASVRFYTEVLGLKLQYRFGDHWASVEAGKGLTIGLHPADVDKLMIQLEALVDAGNTVIVAEHEMRVAAAADWIIDLGPGPGDQGGKIVVAGTPLTVTDHPTSKTAIYLTPLLAPSITGTM